LQDIENEMRGAAQRLETALFEEYWGEPVEPSERLMGWLRRADSFARDWKPSKHLFLAEQAAAAPMKPTAERLPGI